MIQDVWLVIQDQDVLPAIQDVWLKIQVSK